MVSKGFIGGFPAMDNPKTPIPASSHSIRLYPHSLQMNGHFRIRFIGGTNPIYVRPIFVSGLNFREYPHKIWPNIWYERTSILGSWNSHCYHPINHIIQPYDNHVIPIGPNIIPLLWPPYQRIRLYSHSLHLEPSSTCPFPSRTLSRTKPPLETSRWAIWGWLETFYPWWTQKSLVNRCSSYKMVCI